MYKNYNLLLTVWIQTTSHALINITESIRRAFHGGDIGCGVFVDWQKAFDTVDHQIQLEKLNHCGIRGV